MSAPITKEKSPPGSGQGREQDNGHDSTGDGRIQVAWRTARRYPVAQDRRSPADIKARTDPEAFYIAQMERLSGHGQWRSARCPFHDDHHPSLRVNVKTGAFKCMVCGEGGGDVIAFLMKRFDLSFPEALRQIESRAGL